MKALTMNNVKRLGRRTPLIIGLVIFLSAFSILWHSSSLQVAPGQSKSWSHRLSARDVEWDNGDSVAQEQSYMEVPDQPSSQPDDQDYLVLNKPESPLPSSLYLNGVAGYSLFQNLYLRNGTFYYVAQTTEAQDQQLPPVKFIMSAPPNDEGKRNAATDQEFKIIGVDEAEDILGHLAIRLRGASVLLNDQKHALSSSFMGHYFHFGTQYRSAGSQIYGFSMNPTVVETFLGAWRLLAADHAFNLGDGTTHGMNVPRRIMFRTAPEDWRDRAGLTPWFLNNVMPAASVEDKFVWEDRANSGSTFLFEKITISDRFAAHRFGGLNARWNKMSAEVINVEAPKDWIAPLRNNIRNIGAIHGCELERQNKNIPVVTYVNRQKTGRRLNETDAEEVLVKLQELHDEGKIEFHNAQMELLPRVEQFCLASRTDILLGVHGNGLSHQLWMQPGSSVIEVMDVGGFAMDYALPAELMGHNYYATHNDKVFEKENWVTPEGKGTPQSKNFHGKNIRLDPQFIKTLIQDIVQRSFGI